MGIKLIKLITIFIFLVSSLQASPRKYSLGSDIKKLKTSKENLKKIANSITEYEKRLTESNSDFVDLTEEKRDLEYSVDKELEKLTAESDSLTKKKEELKKILSKLFLMRIESQTKTYSLLKRKFLLKKTKKEISQIDQKKIIIAEMRKNLVSLKKKHEQANKKQTALESLMAQMENEKKILADKYVKELKVKEKYQEKVGANRERTIKKLSKNHLNPKLVADFISPLEDASELTTSNGGVTFHFYGKKPLVATKNGKVVYSGPLASYGTVLMIDHGKDVRTVLWGPIHLKKKVGDKVNKGEIVGYAASKTAAVSKVYFDIRIKDKIQKTALLLDKSVLKKHNLIK